MCKHWQLIKVDKSSSKSKYLKFADGGRTCTCPVDWELKSDEKTVRIITSK